MFLYAETMQIIVLILVLIFILPCHAESIKVVTEEYPPYNFTQNGKIIGSATTVLTAILDKAKLDYEIQSYPWSRAILISLEQKNTLIYSISRTPVREEFYYWIGPISSTNKAYLYKLKSRNDLNITKLKQAKHYRVGVVRGWTTAKYLSDKGFSKIEDTTYNGQGMRKLYAGHIDFLVSDIYLNRLSSTKYKLDLSKIEKTVPVFENTDPKLYIALAKSLNSESLAIKLQEALASLELETIFNFKGLESEQPHKIQ